MGDYYSQPQYATTSPAVIVDFQCFKNDNHELLLKEVCVLEVSTGTILLHHIVKPPFGKEYLSESKLRESRWLTKYFHGIEWTQGDIEYNALMSRLRTCLAPRSKIYVKGKEKKDFIIEHLIDTSNWYDSISKVVTDLGEIGCTSLTSLGTLLSTTTARCGHHLHKDSRCALANTIQLRSWMSLAGINKE